MEAEIRSESMNCGGCGKLVPQPQLTDCKDPDCFSAYCSDCTSRNLADGFCIGCPVAVFDNIGYAPDPCSVRARRG